MKNHLTAIIAISLSLPVFAQQTAFYTDPETKFQEAKAFDELSHGSISALLSAAQLHPHWTG